MFQGFLTLTVIGFLVLLTACTSDPSTNRSSYKPSFDQSNFIRPSSNTIVPLATDSLPSKVSSTEMIGQPVSSDNEKDGQIVRDSNALLQARLGQSNRSRGENEKDCLSGSSTSRSDQGNSLQSRFECRQNWFQERMRVNVAYDQQRWDNTSISRLGEVLQAFSNQNNLASSKGSLNIIDEHLKADFDFQHSQSVNQREFRQPVGGQQNVGELSANVRLKGGQDILQYWGEFKFTDDRFFEQMGLLPPRRGKLMKRVGQLGRS